MTESKGNRFTKYFSLLLDALRSVDPRPMRPAEALAWVRANIEVPEADLTRFIVNGSQSIFENDVHWARFYLVKAGLIGKSKRGFWDLTKEGRDTRLTEEDTWALYVRVRDAGRVGAGKDESEMPAPESSDDESESGRSYWFVGSVWHEGDQLSRFLKNGLWENGHEEQFSSIVRRMKAGDLIAVKASFVQKRGLPFDVGGKAVSAMRIKATGIIVENLNNGRTVKVAWNPPFPARNWYFYTYRTTIIEVNVENEDARRLLDFTFRDVAQDYQWFLARPYWAEKYRDGLSMPESVLSSATADDDAGDALDTSDEEPSYTVDDIIADGCFLTRDKLSEILERLKKKKNLILQGSPGTGKTWLAKRLGYALLNSNDRETQRYRLRVVQFHPSLAYEDFVRGWRPAGDGRLALVDGILMQAIEAALSEPGQPLVLVIEEINRGNPSQIFGEMLTLLENTKRRPTEAIELAYRDPKKPHERVYVPDNLFVIGTMNVADRSLAIVDLALRRRFAFVDLEPELGPAWQEWCELRGVDKEMCTLIASRILALNAVIASSISLGPQFRIGHSYVTPDIDETIPDGHAWFRAKVESEIAPLLDEYWFDAPEMAKKAMDALTTEFV